MTLSKDALLDSKCWRDNIIFISKNMQYPPISKDIYNDASNAGWGASCQGMLTEGSWLLEKKQWHINAFERKAMLLGLKFFIKEEKTHIKVFSDICHHFTKLIWEWAEKNTIQITGAHIPEEKNIEAHRESKQLLVDLDYMLCSKSLSKTPVLLNYKPKVDFFCKQCKPSISYLLFLKYRPWSLGCLFIDKWLGLLEIPCLLTVFNHSKRFQEKEGRKCRRYLGCTILSKWTMVFSHIQNDGWRTISTSRKRLLELPPTTTDTAPHLEEDRFGRLSLSRFLTENSGLSEGATGVMEASWNSSTRHRDQGNMYKFSYYCLQRNIEYLT